MSKLLGLNLRGRVQRIAILVTALVSIRIYAESGRPWTGPILCVFRSATGQPCPFCGTTRSVASASLGNFDQALSENAMGLTFTVAMAAVFVSPKLGKSIAAKFERVRTSLGSTRFILLVTFLFGMTWVWNFSRWT
jgi:hypothetical protein